MLRSVVTTAAAVAVWGVCALLGRATAGEAQNPSFLLFSGTDLWRYGAFLYGGGLWSPGGLDASGFALKTLLDGGRYTYRSRGLGENVNGVMASAAVLPGLRFVRGGLTLGIFAGPVVQDYRLTPNDPRSRLRGFYIGGRFAADAWYQPSSAMMASLSGAIASIGPTGYLRAALGYRIFAPAFVGPEAQAIWCGNYQEFQFGAHVTGWHIHSLEWSAGGGWAITSDRRYGPYLHVSVNARY